MKSATNNRKHGIGFHEVQGLWDDYIRIISARRARKKEVQYYES